MNVFRPNPNITLYYGSWEETLKEIKNEVNLLFTSPPFNIGSKSPRIDGRRKYGEYDPKSFAAVDGYEDNMPEEEYQLSQRNFLIRGSQMIRGNGVIAYNHKNRHKKRVLISPERWFPYDVLEQRHQIVIDRGSSHNNALAFPQPCTERLYILSKEEYFTFNKSKTEIFKNTRDVWLYTIPRDRKKTKHCAPFTLEFAREVIFRYSNPGDLVCDPYSGSGTVMIACDLEGRRFLGSEKKKEYFLQSINRYETFKGSING